MLVRYLGVSDWLAAVPKEEWPDAADESFLEKHWCDEYGDRKQEIVFIGLAAEMNAKTIRNQLEACLVQDYLDNPQAHIMLQDPFPAWFEEVDA